MQRVDEIGAARVRKKAGESKEVVSFLVPVS
jgi:hypothetical protein